MSPPPTAATAVAELPTTTVTAVSLFAFIAPAESIASSFGVRSERGVVLIKIEDSSGSCGWGEVWAGMPASGALHRFNLLREFAAPALVGTTFQNVQRAVAQLHRVLLPIVRLAGERGPVAQILGGIDTALWDLQARRLGLPLYRVLGGTQARMRCYASGLAPDTSPARLDILRQAGFMAFKFKAGFDDAKTIPLLLRQQRGLHPTESIMLDANCGWGLAAAKRALAQLEDGDFAWIEEPLGPERPAAEWQALKAMTRLPVAAGENLAAADEFAEAMSWLDIIQPDVAKWGGVSGVHEVGLRAVASNKQFCPHSFGTHIAAIASAHVLAAAGGAFLELDVNHNPLRSTSTYGGWISNGFLSLPESPGLGFEVDLHGIETYCRASCNVRDKT
ncbi:mandelate racemase/muconate lactonizing enzyme family protein [Achromobacter insolitus]|uniref:mandelate racemase/muconate lactonizing enzyme family protein n=1 Tax=Achromobacter insolitus TaxID=217204 RepID=UPI001654FC37|nr:mandelate racemase/muconate lactonizing enzyme family protein [Achromobacter insolitus]